MRVDSEHHETAAPVRACPVVCIGISVGGLEPLKTLFHGLPGDTGMAYVVLHHLRRRPTHLPEILRSWTTMPVLQAAGGLLLRANHIYVLPSGMEMTITGNTLNIAAGKTRGWSDVITKFLLSLAGSEHPKIAVILSGLDDDGAAALEFFKRRGGITIVQELSTAEQPEMPHRALGTGAVDYVLPPEKIPETLRQIAARFRARKAASV